MKAAVLLDIEDNPLGLGRQLLPASMIGLVSIEVRLEKGEHKAATMNE